MPASEYILVPVKNTNFSDKMSPEHWGHWWEGKIPSFDYDDIILERFISCLTPRGGKILEGGCGIGRWVELLSAQGYSCTGVESSEQAITAAMKLFPTRTIRLGDITCLDFISEGEIDTYLSWGVFEHFPEGPTKPLLEAFRVLKPGGILLATIPNYSIYRQLVRPLAILRNRLKSNSLIQRLARKPLSQSVWFEYMYSAREFDNFLSTCGFISLSSTPLFIKHGIHMSSFIFRKNNASLQLNTLGTLIERLSKKYIPSFFAHMNLFVAVKPYTNSVCKEYSDLNEILNQSAI